MIKGRERKGEEEGGEGGLICGCESQYLIIAVNGVKFYVRGTTLIIHQTPVYLVLLIHYYLLLLLLLLLFLCPCVVSVC